MRIKFSGPRRELIHLLFRKAMSIVKMNKKYYEKQIYEASLQTKEPLFKGYQNQPHQVTMEHIWRTMMGNRSNPIHRISTNELFAKRGRN